MLLVALTAPEDIVRDRLDLRTSKPDPKNNSSADISVYNKLKENHEGSFHDANGFDDAYITDIIQELIELDYNIKPIFVKGNWLEIDTPQDLEIASKKLD